MNKTKIQSLENNRKHKNKNKNTIFRKSKESFKTKEKR
jgi:hypothetical protein